MKVEYRKRFLKELASIPSVERKDIERFVFDDLLTLESVTKSGKIERMKGYPGYYKIRFGNIGSVFDWKGTQ